MWNNPKAAGTRRKGKDLSIFQKKKKKQESDLSLLSWLNMCKKEYKSDGQNFLVIELIFKK